jgi:hypothetical protein
MENLFRKKAVGVNFLRNYYFAGIEISMIWNFLFSGNFCMVIVLGKLEDSVHILLSGKSKYDVFFF